MKKHYTRQRKPIANGWNNNILFPILGIFFILAGLALIPFAFQLPWFGRFILFFSKISLITGIVCFAPTIWHIGNRFYLEVIKSAPKRNIRNLDLTCLATEDFNYLLYSLGLCQSDPFDSLRVRYPKVELTNDGFRLPAIGGLTKKMLDDQIIAEFNSFLSLNNTHSRISSSYYRDGYVNYVVEHSIGRDRIHFS